MSLDVFDMPAFDLDALIARVQADELTDADQEILAAMLPHIEAAIQVMFDSIFGFVMPDLGDIFSTFGNTSFASLGGKTYRTEPIPGAELGGIPRNPEADVIDDIDRIVDWQLKGGEGW